MNDLTVLITTYLEMQSPEAFRPAFAENTDAQIITMGQFDAEYYRFLYRTVGEKWRWRDRLPLTDAALAEIIDKPQVTVDVLYVVGVPAGFIELSDQNGDVEVAYFGLRPAFIGRGLGKHLLSHGVRHAWEYGAQRVWLHTCNLDGPHALANYQARGFSIYDVRQEPMPRAYF